MSKDKSGGGNNEEPVDKSKEKPENKFHNSPCPIPKPKPDKKG